MIQSKYITVIVIIMTVLALFLTLVMIGFSNSELSEVFASKETQVEYEEKLFGTEVISIEIIADEAQWQDMIENAIKEEYISVDVIVNGSKFEKVGIRPKGNSSLTQVASSESERYSFRLQFDEYIDGQTCFGLESFVVNNMIGDNSYMKEYISYDIMKEIGVEAPYFGFANITINGESGGLYLAVEMYNSSYEKRTFGTTEGMIYNVKSMDIKQDNMQGGSKLEGMEPPTDRELPDSSVSGNKMQRGEFGEGQREDSGGSLAYSDESSDSYSAIFGNAVGKSSESDYQRVIEALKALEEGENIEDYYDVDQILRYLAAHTIVVNLDSYSSSMAQNYYLYELDGKITILPWDYNLAWGGFQTKDASSVVNFPIDTPVSGVTMEDRPLLEKLLGNETYLETYHTYLQELMDTYFANGVFTQKILLLDSLIADYVKQDATAFCSYEEYKAALPTFIELGELRSESIQGQLDGTIPTTKEAQEKEATKLINAERVNLNDLGTMMAGKDKPTRISD